MKNSKVFLVVGVCFWAIGNLAMAVEKVDVGREEYRENCLNCHGQAGDGNGPYASLLKKSASDLTGLTKANKGVFPFSRVYEVIDGRELVTSHGEREMPIWGNAYRVAAGEYYVDVPYNPEVFVRSRILALIEYISRLQKN